MIDMIEKDRERIDLVAKRLYGTARGGTVEGLLAANPGLADKGPFLTRGQRIRVPLKPDRKPDPALTRPWE